MAVGFKRPLALSLTPIENIESKQAKTESLSVVDLLRNKFNTLNNEMFNKISTAPENLQILQIKNIMLQVANECLDRFNTEPIYGCNDDARGELKTTRTSIPNNFFIGDTYYNANISGVYVYSCDNNVYKQIRFLINDTNCFFKLILEICLQKYAASLNCGIKIPQIISYSLSREKKDGEDTDFLLFDIKMEKVDIIDIRNEENKKKILDNYQYFLTTIKNGLDCFERNGLYHNDTHSDNIGFYNSSNSTNNIQVVLMDFGKATITRNQRYQSPSGFYKQIDSKEKFEEWLGRKIQVNDGSKDFYGGKYKYSRRIRQRGQIRQRIRRRTRNRRYTKNKKNKCRQKTKRR